MIKIDNINSTAISLQYRDRLKALRYMDGRFNHLFSKNLDDLVLCKPSDMQAKALVYDNLITAFKDEFIQYMIGQYERVMYKEGLGVWLTEQLGVNVCPYCNRQYTFTVNRATRSIRPQLDHFYPKSIYPYFALSFYNLIPSCPECNRIKKDIQLSINPYESDFGDCNFMINNLGEMLLGVADKSHWSVDFKNITPKHTTHIDTFALRELYNGHKDYVEEIVFKATTLTDVQLANVNQLLRQVTGVKIDKNTAKRIIFGNYTSKSDFGKRPLSKLTADILEQLKI